MPRTWIDFFCGSQPGDLAGSHDPLLVLLSVVIAAAGSYTALDLAGRVRVSSGSAHHFWLALSATAMGGSIWSMHFVAMLAFHLSVPIAYGVLPTLLSLIAAILVSAAGLGIAGRVKVATPRSMLAAGTFLGFGVSIMHYTGMAAMEMNAGLSYDPWLFALSIVIAIAAGTTALWLAFTLDRLIHKLLAAVVMAAAIAGMHYTAMAAANYTPHASDPPVTEIASVPLLAVVVAVATFGVLALGLLSAAMDRRFAAQAERESVTLRQSERYLRTILNNAHDAYVAIDAHGAIVEWNAEATRIFGWSRQEVLGRSFAAVTLAEPDRAALRAQLRDYLDTRSTAALDTRNELWTTRKDGTGIAVEMTLAAVTLHGQVTFHAFLHDISAHKAAERELVLAKEMAESSNRAKSQFLAHMSHELRTPLNAIIGFSEIIRDRVLGPIDEDIYRNYAGDIHSSGQHLLEVINDILDLSKAEGGYLEIDAQPFHVPDMLVRCADTMRELARTAGVELSLSTEDGLPMLAGEERRIRQIVINLLSNAVKFTPDGGRVMVRTGFSADGDLQIVVEDTGIGMTEKQVEVALTPFGQVESHMSRRHDGAGLGLPLAKRFAELHDGTLVVDSTPDIGTRVTVTFPQSRLRLVHLLAKTA